VSFVPKKSVESDDPVLGLLPGCALCALSRLLYLEVCAYAASTLVI